MLVVEQWAELRRLHFTENVGVRELARRLGLHRKTSAAHCSALSH